jgi:hypothetical protein
MLAEGRLLGMNCDIKEHVVTLHWHGKAAEIRVESESYIAERGMYLDPLQDIGKFHEELLERESKGCLSLTETRRIRRAVAERFPLPPSIAYRYELGSCDTTGFFELTRFPVERRKSYLSGCPTEDCRASIGVGGLLLRL